MKNCTQALKYICDNLDAKMDSPRCREMLAHLEECPDCAAYLDSMKKTVLLYRRTSAAPVPKDVHKILTETLRREQSKSGRKPGRPHA